jgi:hypothetical protein
MTWNVPRTWVSGEVLSKALLDEQVRDNLSHLKIKLELEAAVELTISSGEVTKTRSHHTIDTQGDTPSDDLDTVNGGTEGDIILVRPADDSRTVVIKHATGNIWNPALEDIVLDDAGDYCFLIYNDANWCAISGGLSSAAVVALIAAHSALTTGVHGVGSSHVASQKWVDDNFNRMTLGFVIFFLPSSTGLYYDDTNHDVRIRTSVAVPGDNILMAHGFNWKDGLYIWH